MPLAIFSRGIHLESVAVSSSYMSFKLFINRLPLLELNLMRVPMGVLYVFYELYDKERSSALPGKFY